MRAIKKLVYGQSKSWCTGNQRACVRAIKELVYRKSKSQLNNHVRTESLLTVQVSSRGQKANEWHGLRQCQTHTETNTSMIGHLRRDQLGVKQPDVRQLHTPHFVPVSSETFGVFDDEADESAQQVGWRCKAATGDANETSYRFQQVLIAVQRGNDIAYLDRKVGAKKNQCIFSLWLC